MRALLFFLLLLTIPPPAPAQTAQQLRLHCQWFDTTGIRPNGNQYFSDVWGFTAGGIAYGVIGSTAGAHIIRVSDCRQVAFYPGRNTNVPVAHRDYKTYGHYLYAVADEGPATLQVFDLNALPGTLPLVYESNPDTPLLAHTLFIDTATARLYLAAPKGNAFGQDFLRVYSLANPAAPVLTHRLNARDGIGDKVHTIFARNDTAFLSASNYGLLIGRFDAANQFSILGRFSGYPQQGFNHSSWINEKGTGIMADETHGLELKVLDATRLPALRIQSFFSPCSGDTCVPHNTFMRGDLAFIAHYYQGLQIYSLADPTAPVRIGYYDTYAPPAGVGGFAGAWGCYPFLPGGQVLISDMQTGFYVVDASGVLGVENNPAPLASLVVFPNPAADFIILEWPEPLPLAAGVEIRDGVAGKLLLQTGFPAGTKTLRVPLSPQAPAGLYFVRITTPETVVTRRFFKK